MGMEDYFGGNNTHLHIKDVFLKYIDYLYASTRLQLLCIHMYIFVCMCLYIASLPFFFFQIIIFQRMLRAYLMLFECLLTKCFFLFKSKYKM